MAPTSNLMLRWIILFMTIFSKKSGKKKIFGASVQAGRANILITFINQCCHHQLLMIHYSKLMMAENIHHWRSQLLLLATDMLLKLLHLSLKYLALPIAPSVTLFLVLFRVLQHPLLLFIHIKSSGIQHQILCLNVSYLTSLLQISLFKSLRKSINYPR